MCSKARDIEIGERARRDSEREIGGMGERRERESERERDRDR